MKFEAPNANDAKWSTRHWIRLFLYGIETLIFVPLVLCVPLMGMGHAHPTAFGEFAYFLGLGTMMAGTILIVTNLKPAHRVRSLFLRLTGLFLHATTMFAIIDDGMMLVPTNWAKLWLADIVTFQGGFIVLAIADLILHQRPKSRS